MARPVTAADAYTPRAAEYAAVLGSVATVHPADRLLVETWVDQAGGPVLDAGCGPGHWTDHLARRGVAARGIDLSPAFVSHARATYPGVPFVERAGLEIVETHRRWSPAARAHGAIVARRLVPARNAFTPSSTP